MRQWRRGACRSDYNTASARLSVASKSETHAATPRDFLAQHVQGYVAAQCHLLPGPYNPRTCSASRHNYCLHTIHLKTLKSHCPTAGILLHCFNWDVGPHRTSSLLTNGSSFKRKKTSSPYGPYLPGTFHCEEVVRSRTLSHASQKKPKDLFPQR